MARKLRLEAEDGIYHVLNRGNYRADVFRSDKTKAAFLQCLGEACETPERGQALGFGVDGSR